MSSVRKLQTREQIILDHLPQVRSLASRVHRRCPSNVALEDRLRRHGRTHSGRQSLRWPSQSQTQDAGRTPHSRRHDRPSRQLDPLPRAVRQFQRKRDAAEAEFERTNFRRPCDEELALELGISVAQYRGLARAATAGAVVSLDGIAQEGGRPYEIPAPPAGGRDYFLEIRIHAAIDSLPPVERTTIIYLRSGMEIREIAARMGVSRGRVSQIKKHAMQLLRFSLGVVLGDASMTRA